MLRREQIERLKERYPAGTVVRLGQMEERRGGKECRSRWSPYH